MLIKSPTQINALKVMVMLLYVAIFFFLIDGYLAFVWFLLGVVFGVSFLVADETYFYTFYVEKAEKFLVTRSPLFLLALLPISVMVLTSFGSLWASGAIGGMMLWLLLEMLALRKQPAAFKARFLKGVKVTGEGMINTLLAIGWTFFLVVHLLTVL